VAEQVEIDFHRAAATLIPPGSHVLVAVSGGGDSVALLHLLRRWGTRRALELTVAHLDHAMRRGSTSDRRFVEALAAKGGLPFIAERYPVKAQKRKDESLEEAARRVRRGFLLEAAKASGAALIATGHTLDDQAETILLRFARGAGPAALAGMAVAGPGPFVRPLLGIVREDLRRWLRRKRLRFVDDPTNDSLAFDRNRVRRLVVPVLAKAVNPRAARHLVEAADRLRSDAAFLDAVAGARLADVGRTAGGAPAIDAAGLVSLPGPIASRVARLALEQAGCDPRRISSRHVDALRKLGVAPEGSSLSLPGRRRVSKRNGLLEFG
jgi:tRNA(Ile)-lysidine synthase